MTVHDPSACAGRACCIHNPSAHHMAGWPRHWRPDRYLMERICPHGVGHPDPDHMAHILEINPREALEHGIHGCDGCCAL